MATVEKIIVLVFGLFFIIGGFLELSPPFSYVAIVLGIIMVARSLMELSSEYGKKDKPKK